MQLPPPYLPKFLPENGISEELGKQDKIEIGIEGFETRCANTGEIDATLNYLGAPPPVYQGAKRTRTRQNHGNNYGWIFNTIDTREWSSERTVDVRRGPLVVEPEQAGMATPPPMQAPLFIGDCKWKAVEDSTERHTPWTLTGILDLWINPTRFMLHRSSDEDLPKGILKRKFIPASFDGETSYDKEDNFLPLAGAFRVAPTPKEWQQGVTRYLGKIVEGIGSELKRACDHVGNRCKTDALTFNVKKVETYWEYLSEDPVGLVRDLEKHIRTFSSRRREKRTYDTVTSGIDGDKPLLKIQTAKGEWLKIYAKTNRRIRIEVTHLLTGDDRFQFPRTYTRPGKPSRSSKHTFDSEKEVVSFLNRVREQAAKVVNEFLDHVAEQSRVISSPVSSSQALLDIAWALQSYRRAARPITSLLINNQCISVGRWPEVWQQALNSLCEQKIIKMAKGGEVYRVTPRYRPAVEELKKLGLFPVLENKPSQPDTDEALKSGAKKVRVRRRISPHIE